MSVRRLNAVVHGNVQGVAFRYYTRDQAEQSGLKGWVRNLHDGTVETEFEGDEQEVEKMLAWLSEGSPASSVSKIVTREIEPVGLENGFQITYE